LVIAKSYIRQAPEAELASKTIVPERQFDLERNSPHIGIYIGNGLMIDAPAEGEVVQATSVFTGY
jgi:hypothetical protein